MITNRQVMIVDDDRALVDALKARCEQLGLHAVGISNGADAVSAIARFAPDLVILDVNMPTSDGVSVCSALAANASLAPIPVIILSGRSDEETIERCRELGAHYVLKSGDVWTWLEPLIVRLLDLPADEWPTEPVTSVAEDDPASEPTVLVIDDDADLCRALQVRLAAHHIRVIHANTGMRGYWAALRSRPGAIICDYNMPEGRGDYVINRLRQHSLTRDIPIFVLTGWRREGLTDFGLEREMANLGAKRFFMKPLDFDVLLEELRAHLPLSDDPCIAPRQPVLTT